MTKEIHKILGTKKSKTRLSLIDLSRTGISMKILSNILAYTSLNMKEVAGILPISERQLVRYEKSHVLKKEISSHLIQVVELYARGYDVFEDKGNFDTWMRRPNKALNKHMPLALLDTSLGIQMVADILGRIEHGVYS